MSRTALEYRPDYPIAFQNQSGETIPAFGLIQLEDASRLTAALAPKALAPDDDGEDALFVNSPTEQADGSTTGTCRSVHDGPFWVATDDTYAFGDVIGPMDGQFLAGLEGSPLFKVVFPHETLEIALCVVIGVGDKFDAITTGAITTATDAKTGATTFGFTFLVRDAANPGDLKNGASGTGTNRSLDLSVPSGTYVVVARIAGEWRPIWVDCG